MVLIQFETVFELLLIKAVAELYNHKIYITTEPRPGLAQVNQPKTFMLYEFNLKTREYSNFVKIQELASLYDAPTHAYPKKANIIILGTQSFSSKKFVL